ncbi:MAG: DUF485 domain-containing protein [Halothiobacillus sp.]|nr:DUF485 domain-containing protein [Halothiobacillus sp.]
MESLRKADLAERIASDPDFQHLIKRRTGYGWMMAFIIMLVYFTFILLIAYNPQLLATKISAGSTISVGIVAGFLIIIFSFVMTGLYVHKANAQFDEITAKIKESHE